MDWVRDIPFKNKIWWEILPNFLPSLIDRLKVMLTYIILILNKQLVEVCTFYIIYFIKFHSYRWDMHGTSVLNAIIYSCEKYESNYQTKQNLWKINSCGPCKNVNVYSSWEHRGIGPSRLVAFNMDLWE